MQWEIFKINNPFWLDKIRYPAIINETNDIKIKLLWSVPIDKARVDVLDYIRKVLGQFIIWHALNNAEWSTLSISQWN